MAYKGKLVQHGTSAKTLKSDAKSNETGYLSGILYMTPADGHGLDKPTLCPMAIIASCKSACLNTAGRGAMNCVQKARLRKARYFLTNRDAYMLELFHDCRKFSAYCQRKGLNAAVRLNGTSDIPYESIPLTIDGVTYPNIMSALPNVQFYDYTKIAKRTLVPLPANYHLILSYSMASERYERICFDAMAMNPELNVAVVFRSKEMRDAWIGHELFDRTVIDGDSDDLRFLDPKGSIVGLYAKGKAKKDNTGFVIDAWPIQERIAA